MKPSWAIRGRASHAAEEQNYKQKLESHVDISLSDAKDIAAAAFDTELNSGNEEVIWQEDEQPGDVKDQVVLGVGAYHVAIAPRVQPVMVEEKVDAILPWGTHVTGRIDVIDQDVAIRDSKHAAYAPKPGEEWYQTQPGLYAWIYRKLTGEIPRFIFDYVILGRKGAKNPSVGTASIEATITEQRMTLALKRIQAAEQGIRNARKTGIVGANPSVFNCAGCGYRRICPYSASKK